MTVPDETPVTEPRVFRMPREARWAQTWRDAMREATTYGAVTDALMALADAEAVEATRQLREDIERLRDEAEAKLWAIAQLHEQSFSIPSTCQTCGVAYPCETLRAVLARSSVTADTTTKEQE